MLSTASVSSFTAAAARSSQYPLSIPCWQFFLFIKLHRIIKLRPCVPLLNNLCQILQMCKVQLRRPEAGVILLASLKQCTHKNFISSKLNLKSSVRKEDLSWSVRFLLISSQSSGYHTGSFLCMVRKLLLISPKI